jgi:hypothetical protein
MHNGPQIKEALVVQGVPALGVGRDGRFGGRDGGFVGFGNEAGRRSGKSSVILVGTSDLAPVTSQ